MTTDVEAVEMVHLQFKVCAVIDPNGEDPAHLASQMNWAFEGAIASGALTGHTAAEVDEYSAETVRLSSQAAALDEQEIAQWLAQQIESGAMNLEDLPRLMARYALADPAAMREEFAERMGLSEPESDGPEHPREGA